jgi:hypothetical protein
MKNERGIPAPRQNRRFRLIWGLLAGAMLVGVATTAVAAPVMSPGVVAPVARLVNTEPTKAARGAYVDAQLQNGYELLPAMQMSAAE